MMEAGVVVDLNGEALHWHLPEGRSGGSLPDHVAKLPASEEAFRKANLWYVFWDNRDSIKGFAHSHPGGGVPGPSYTDVTTFAAIEDALGQRLDWWITSDQAVVVCRWAGPHRLTYQVERLAEDPSWVAELRRLSK